MKNSDDYYFDSWYTAGFYEINTICNWIRIYNWNLRIFMINTCWFTNTFAIHSFQDRIRCRGNFCHRGDFRGFCQKYSRVKIWLLEIQLLARRNEHELGSSSFSVAVPHTWLRDSLREDWSLLNGLNECKSKAPAVPASETLCPLLGPIENPATDDRVPVWCFSLVAGYEGTPLHVLPDHREIKRFSRVCTQSNSKKKEKKEFAQTASPVNYTTSKNIVAGVLVPSMSCVCALLPFFPSSCWGNCK